MSATTLRRLVEPLEDFEVWYDGVLLKIRAKAGQFFATDHEIVRKHPEKFGVARAIVLGGARVSAAREQKTARPAQRTRPAPPRTRPAPSPSLPVHETTGKPIRITRRALEEIADECRRWRGQIETGGGLLINADGQRPVITDATTVASDRERDSVATNLFTIWFHRQCRQRDATARLLVGAWHTHPRGSTDPSSDDLALWQDLLAKSRDSSVFGVIVTEQYADDGYQETPRLYAFRVRVGETPIVGDEALLVERCDVETLAR